MTEDLTFCMSLYCDQVDNCYRNLRHDRPINEEGKLLRVVPNCDNHELFEPIPEEKT